MAGDETQRSAYEDTPAGNARRWTVEFDVAKKRLEKFQEQGEKILKRYLDERETKLGGETRLNLLHSNIQTQRAMLYGKTPQVTVERRFADAADDVARVAAEMLERNLNSDIEKEGDTCAEALSLALDDRLLPGLGVVRLRYEAEFATGEETPAILDEETGEEKAPAVPAVERKSYECVETDYVHWKDFLWGSARVWHEVPWVAFRAQMTREQLEKRFPDAGKVVPLNSNSLKSATSAEKKEDTPWSRADVWEIWERETKRTYWFVEGYAQTLDEQDDPLGLDEFFPCPRPLFANLTTSKLVPRGDYVLSQDIYDEIDYVSTRITLLERAVRVVGCYDSANTTLGRLLTDANSNEMIPVANFAAHAEKGGIAGAVDWLPLEQVVNALSVLRDYRSELMETLFQVTGMSDIMRGQAAMAGVTATEQSIKAKFGGVRMQAMQDEFARFASDCQRLKAEIISKHFDPETIIAGSNIDKTPDAQFAQQAVELIKSDLSCYRIQIKPEAISLTDFAQLKSERMEVLQSIGGFFQVMAPVAQAMPGSMPFLLQMLQVSVAGLRGASAYEAVLDQAIATAEKQAQQQAAQPQQPPPDPRLMAQQMKGQQDLTKIQAEVQADAQRAQIDVQAEQQKQAIQTQENLKEHVQRLRIDQVMKPQVSPFGGMKR